jgi:hypothetical protein
LKGNKHTHTHTQQFPKNNNQHPTNNRSKRHCFENSSIPSSKNHKPPQPQQQTHEKKTFTKLSNPKNHQSFKNPTPTKKHTQSPNSVCATLCVRLCVYVSISLYGICLKQNRKPDLKNWYPQKCSCNNEARTTTTTTTTEKNPKKLHQGRRSSTIMEAMAMSIDKNTNQNKNLYNNNNNKQTNKPTNKQHKNTNKKNTSISREISFSGFV